MGGVPSEILYALTSCRKHRTTFTHTHTHAHTHTRRSREYGVQIEGNSHPSTIPGRHEMRCIQTNTNHLAPKQTQITLPKNKHESSCPTDFFWVAVATADVVGKGGVLELSRGQRHRYVWRTVRVMEAHAFIIVLVAKHAYECVCI